MKKLLTYSILALSISATAQSLQRQVISPMGGVQSNGTITLSSTVGQAISGVIGEGASLSQGFQQNLTVTQDIQLREGWGMVSTHVRPYNKDVAEVYAAVETDLKIAKNNNADVYMPEFGYNGIGDWNFKEGYQYNMNAENVLTVRGSRVIPELNPIAFSEGWNMMAYLRNSPADVIAILDGIASDITILKDEDGNLYMPEFGFNGIGNFNPGKGYQIKTTTTTQLAFESNATEYRLEQNDHKTIAHNTKRFARPVNTGSNHTVLILESAWNDTPQQGDEIAAYDSKGNMVGSVALQNGHNAIAIWGDDEYTQEKEGLENGEVFTLVFYNNESDVLSEIKVSDWERGNDVFAKDGMSVIAGFEQQDVIAQEMELFQNVPNPVRVNTEIGFYLPEDTRATITLTNSIGQEVVTITNKDYERGYHSVNLERETLSSGMYFYSLKTHTKTLTKQLTIIE
jgi:hypothetical protein